ncbi:MAG: HlyD family efflux transporter periplasmic adaptor subunit [Alphaproteobacteria bacterium]|nr:HlyD family efflux transporter periplasmic adaptor subunit [Alphaproteobacteria bacterium]
MNSPYRTHPALPHVVQAATAKTIPFPAAAAAPPPRPQGPSKLERLVALEGEIRNLPTASAIGLHALNETQALVGHEQAFWIRLDRRGVPKVELASSIARVDAQAPLFRQLVMNLRKAKDLREPVPINLKFSHKQEAYPFEHGFWAPFLDRRKGACFGGILFVRAKAFDEAEVLIAKRLGQTYGHAFLALTPPTLLRKFAVPRWALAAAALVLAVLFFIPVPMTSLAPFEVIAREPALVTAPMDGAISEVIAEPNTHVKEGEVLFRFDDTVLRAEATIAAQKAFVAEAKLAAAQNGAFTDLDAKRAMGELQAEVDLAHAERDYAVSLLNRSVARAPKAGVLVYAAKSDLIGKPVRVGEKIMEVADPSDVAYRIDLAVHDSISLEQSSRVKLFFDADPLRPRAANLFEMSYHATEKAGGLLAYSLKAKPLGEEAQLRIGSRGTAQVAGQQVSLGFYLFRRPIAALRQYLGM